MTKYSKTCDFIQSPFSGEWHCYAPRVIGWAALLKGLSHATMGTVLVVLLSPSRGLAAWQAHPDYKRIFWFCGKVIFSIFYKGYFLLGIRKFFLSVQVIYKKRASRIQFLSLCIQNLLTQKSHSKTTLKSFQALNISRIRAGNVCNHHLHLQCYSSPWTIWRTPIHASKPCSSLYITFLKVPHISQVLNSSPFLPSQLHTVISFYFTYTSLY